MKRLIFTGFLLFYAGLIQAKLTVQTGKDQVSLQQPFRLTLTVDSQSSEIPDLTPLQKDFKVVGTENNSSYSMVNGRASAITQWTVLLLAKRSGVLTIPPLQVGSEKTAATSIEVTEGEPVEKQRADKQKEFYLTAEASEKNPYVNQQIIYTVRLFNSKRLLDMNYQDVEVADALKVRLGQGRRYQSSVNGHSYVVEEQQYAIFPQKSGPLKINPPSLTALVYDTVPQRVHTTAEAINLQVKPIPDQFHGQKWLPAKQVRLTEEYDKRDTTLTQGTTLVRTVNLQAVGLPAQLLPALSFASNEGISVYPEKAVEKNSFSQPDLTGSTTVKVTYLFNKPGQAVVPALKLHWFNTVTAREEQASLPELTVNVTPIAADNKPAASPASSGKSAETVKPATTAPLVQPEKSSLAWWLAGVFAFAWLLTLGLWWRGRSVPVKTPGEKQLLQAVKDACLANQAEAARKALMDWAKWQWPNARILSLANLAELIADADLQQQINELSKFLYQTGQQGWHGEALWQSIKGYKPSASDRKKAKDDLPPVYPEL